MTTGENGGRQEWRSGWSTVAAAFVGYGATSFNVIALGTLIAPLSAELGWTRAQITGALLLMGISAILLNPLIGLSIDRFGTRLVAIIGAIAYPAAIALIALTGPAIWTWYAAWSLAALSVAPIGPVVWATAVVSSFDKARGLAIGIFMCGNGVANILTPLVVVRLLPHWGTRGVYVALALLTLLFVLPAACLLPKRPGASPAPADSVRSPAPVVAGTSLRQALPTLRFWLIGLPLGVCGGVTAALIFHMQPFFIDRGVAPAAAAAMMAGMGAALIVGRLLAGVLLDRLPARFVAAAVVLMPAVCILLLLRFDGSLQIGIAAVLMLGLAYGAENDVLAFVTTAYFGRRHFAAVYGMMIGIFALFYSAGPMIAGVLFEATGSYQPMLWGMIVALAIGAAAVASLGRTETGRH